MQYFSSRYIFFASRIFGNSASHFFYFNFRTFRIRASRLNIGSARPCTTLSNCANYCGFRPMYIYCVMFLTWNVGVFHEAQVLLCLCGSEGDGIKRIFSELCARVLNIVTYETDILIEMDFLWELSEFLGSKESFFPKKEQDMELEYNESKIKLWIIQ